MLRFKDNKCNMLTFSVIFEQIHTVIYIYIYAKMWNTAYNLL